LFPIDRGLALFFKSIGLNDSLQYDDNEKGVQSEMPETTELILGIGALILVILLTRKYHAWRIKRAYIFIIDDLKNKRAYSAHSAVELPYTKINRLRMGLRQHHPQALDHLIMQNVVAKTEDRRYYLVQKNISL
jgi:hypothetical protein